MPKPLLETYAEQFFGWERNARGDLQALDAPVKPEPPFREFPGYVVPRQLGDPTDDGRRPSVFGNLIGGDPAGRPRAEATAEAEEDFAFEWCHREEPIEVAVSCPPDLSPSPHALRQFLQGLDGLRDPVSFEVVASEGATEVQFAVSEADVGAIEAGLGAFFPDVVLDIRTGHLAEGWQVGSTAFVLECGLREISHLPLATGHALDPFVGLVGALASLPPGCCVVYQVLFQRALHRWGDSIDRTVYAPDGSLIFPGEEELAKAAAAKARSPLFGVVLRLAVVAECPTELWGILTRVGSVLGVYANPDGNALRPVVLGDYPFPDQEADLVRRRSRRFGMLLGIDELAGLVHLPSAEVRSPSLVRHVSRSHPAPPELDASVVASGVRLGTNLHRGQRREVALPPDARVRHMHVIGTPASGKSNLLGNMISDDIARGEGLAVLDPHGDLVDSVIARIPRSRLRDVVLLDPTDTEASVGINVLSASSEAERTLLASDLVSMFERLSTTWGDQMNVVLRNAILAFLASDEGGTLADLRRFLVDEAVRERFLPTVHDLHVREYWEVFFDQTASKASVGAVVTRLGQLLESPTIRYVLGQKHSTVDFGEIMNSGKVFLCKLPAGLVGENDAHLFGSLIVSKLQQTAMARQSIPQGERRDFWLYIDEFQHFLTPSMAQIIAETRKYRMGMILAHQFLQQLDHDRNVASAVDLMHTKVVFSVSDQDAKRLAVSFSHFADSDLRTLDQGSAVVRVGRSDHDFNLQVPLYPRATPDAAERASRRLVAMSRERYSRPRSEIDEEMQRAMRRPRPPTDAPGDLTSPKGSPGPVRPAPPPAIESAAEEQVPTPGEGRGGAEHRGAVMAIRNVAEGLGFLSTVEKPLEPGGYVDLEVVTPAGPVAFEVCITTDTAHEAANVLKCAEAGYRRVITVCRGKRKVAAIQERLHEIGLPEGVAVEQINYPVAPGVVERILGSPAPTEGDPAPPDRAEPVGETRGPRVFGSRRVASHFSAADDPTSRQLAQRALRLIEELMAEPKPPEEQP